MASPPDPSHFSPQKKLTFHDIVFVKWYYEDKSYVKKSARNKNPFLTRHCSK